MQRRDFKDAMREMSEHAAAKIDEHVETLSRINKEEKGELLKFGSIEMDTDFPRTVLYAILKRVVDDFKPRNDNHKDTMEKVLGTLNVGKDPFETQKEITKKFTNEAVKQ